MLLLIRVRFYITIFSAKKKDSKRLIDDIIVLVARNKSCYHLYGETTSTFHRWMVERRLESYLGAIAIHLSGIFWICNEFGYFLFIFGFEFKTSLVLIRNKIISSADGKFGSDFGGFFFTSRECIFNWTGELVS